MFSFGAGYCERHRNRQSIKDKNQRRQNSLSRLLGERRNSFPRHHFGGAAGGAPSRLGCATVRLINSQSVHSQCATDSAAAEST